jgi:short-subunit dehydrogenase
VSTAPVIVITGASSGIGRALALRAGRAGYAVVGIGRDRAALASLEQRVRDEGGRIVVDAIDCSVAANASRVVALATRSFGRIDVLVNNAGAVAIGPLVGQSDAALQTQFGTHAIFPLALVREALAALRESRGIVVMLGSGVARIPAGGMGAYPPSKAALRSATIILRRELRAEGIAVTYVDPAVVDTPFMRRAGMPGAPVRIMTTPEQVARRILAALPRRPRTIDAVPWQTALVALGERFPRITELVLTRAPALVGAGGSAQPVLTTTPPTTSDPQPPASTFEAALEPVRRRMERVKLGAPFVRELLRPGEVLDPGEIALRWAGMPNKNERAATIEVLDALAEAGFLERDAERYRVIRAPD